MSSRLNLGVRSLRVCTRLAIKYHPAKMCFRRAFQHVQYVNPNHRDFIPRGSRVQFVCFRPARFPAYPALLSANVTCRPGHNFLVRQFKLFVRNQLLFCLDQSPNIYRSMIVLIGCKSVNLPDNMTHMTDGWICLTTT